MDFLFLEFSTSYFQAGLLLQVPETPNEGMLLCHLHYTDGVTETPSGSLSCAVRGGPGI